MPFCLLKRPLMSTEIIPSTTAREKEHWSLVYSSHLNIFVKSDLMSWFHGVFMYGRLFCYSWLILNSPRKFRTLSDVHHSAWSICDLVNMLVARSCPTKTWHVGLGGLRNVPSRLTWVPLGLLWQSNPVCWRHLTWYTTWLLSSATHRACVKNGGEHFVKENLFCPLGISSSFQYYLLEGYYAVALSVHLFARSSIIVLPFQCYLLEKKWYYAVALSAPPPPPHLFVRSSISYPLCNSKAHINQCTVWILVNICSYPWSIFE